MHASKVAVAEDNKRSRSTKAQSGIGESRQGDVDADSIRNLSRQVEVLTKTVIRMSNAPPTWTHHNPSTRSVPVEERSRCALLSLPNEVIEIINDNEDDAFMSEPARAPKTKKPKRVSV